MAEGQVSIEGKSTLLPDPFFLIATESPVESEGTFPLPEVQKDRFFLSLSIGYPTVDAEMSVMLMQKTLTHPIFSVSPVSDLATLVGMQKAVLEVFVDPALQRYILAIVKSTRQDGRLLFGVSPRGTLALYKGAQAMAALKGRDYVVPEDVQRIALDVLRKRILLKSEHLAKGLTEEQAIREILAKVEVPPLKDAL
jgi:MoxR-like ATPase